MRCVRAGLLATAVTVAASVTAWPATRSAARPIADYLSCVDYPALAPGSGNQTLGNPGTICVPIQG